MVSPRVGRSGPSVVVAVLLAGLLGLGLGAVPALAQPAPPADNAEDAAAALEQVQRDAEVLTEQWHAAKDELTARESEAAEMQAAVEPARLAVESARDAEEQFRRQIDVFAMSTFEGGNLDQFNALLGSGSPQDFLDQMSALELLASDQEIVLDQLLAVVNDTDAAQGEADAAAARAAAAVEAAALAAQDLEARKREAEIRIDEAERLLERLSPQQRADRAGPGAGGPDGPVAGSGAGVEALNAAITRLGMPYKWGAEGPGSFDCSGLTSWAFAEAGITLPRSSSQQARVGQAVSRDDVRAGDLVFFYSPVSHVGIAVDNDTMINSPQTGDVVKYASISGRDFAGARRL
ncbi:NlpC/P60 family protein [Pseudonocardia sp.]|uniref:NlpC/P60 family protein n=1 Tax=Pseudonocardia sp. TaxID=60912 RepID=UPI0026172D7E|nr:NlpC/P60 family protein [Pseudonocardia sp.]